jgi:hypothetical protein
MGFAHGKTVLASLARLYWADIKDICRGLASEYGMDTPTVDVDCSNVCYRKGKTARGVSAFLVALSKLGAAVVPVCDGRRPIAKQATNVRFADREKKRIGAYVLRMEILSLQRKLKTESLTETEKNDIRGTIDSKQRSMKSKETQSRSAPETSFEEKPSAAIRGRPYSVPTRL